MPARHRRFTSASIAIALAVIPTAHAANLYWQTGTGNLTDPNYFNSTTATPGNTPAAGDILYLGAGGAISSALDLSVGKLYIGHADNGGTTAAPAGSATLSVTAGTLAATAGASNSVNAGIIVGNKNSGTLNIDGSSTTVSSNRLVVVGFGNSASQSANLNITNGATLTISLGNLNIGDASSGSIGLPGHVTVAGNINGGSPPVQIGVVAANSSYLQSAGTVNAGATTLGLANADGSSYTLSGGTYNTSTFTLATGTAAQGFSDNVSATVNGGTLSLTGALTFGATTTTTTAGVISGTGSSSNNASLSVSSGSVSTSGALNIGTSATFTNSGVVTTVGSTANSTSLSFTGGTFKAAAGVIGVNGSTTSNTSLLIGGSANVTFTGNLVLADSTSHATDTSLTIADNGHLTDTGTSGVFIGRGTSANSTVTQTGGTFDITNRYLLASATNATGVVVTQSAGIVNTGLDVRVGDTGGTATYNLSSSGVLNATQGLLVGRQKSISVFNQTGGTLNISGGTITTTGATTGATLRIGDAESATNSLWSTATYNLSAGSATATLPAGSTGTYTMTVGVAGTGTMRMIGDAGSLNITGNVLIRTVAPATGTLAFQLLAGHSSLSPLNATGFVTLDPASILQLDFNSVTPTQGVYTVVNAASIVNNGFTPSIPAGWSSRITTGGAGQILQFFAGDANGDGVLDADDYALLDRGFAKHLTGPTNGDFNYDGAVNSLDYSLIDSAYASQHPTLLLDPSFLATRESQFGDAYVSNLISSVPEPTSLLAACGFALPLLSRRRHA